MLKKPKHLKQNEQPPYKMPKVITEACRRMGILRNTPNITYEPKVETDRVSTDIF